MILYRDFTCCCEQTFWFGFVPGDKHSEANKMPTFTVETNVSQKDFPENWHKEATDLIANILSKPVQYVLVQSFPDVNMTFAGTTEPCASVKLTSIGGISEKANRGHVATITEFIERTLKVPRDRMYINFFEGRRDMIGWNNKLFA